MRTVRDVFLLTLVIVLAAVAVAATPRRTSTPGLQVDPATDDLRVMSPFEKKVLALEKRLAAAEGRVSTLEAQMKAMNGHVHSTNVAGHAYRLFMDLKKDDLVPYKPVHMQGKTGTTMTSGPKPAQ
jgi:TolA-binding protein